MERVRLESIKDVLPPAYESGLIERTSVGQAFSGDACPVAEGERRQEAAEYISDLIRRFRDAHGNRWVTVGDLEATHLTDLFADGYGAQVNAIIEAAADVWRYVQGGGPGFDSSPNAALRLRGKIGNNDLLVLLYEVALPPPVHQGTLWKLYVSDRHKSVDLHCPDGQILLSLMPGLSEPSERPPMSVLPPLTGQGDIALVGGVSTALCGDVERLINSGQA